MFLPSFRFLLVIAAYSIAGAAYAASHPARKPAPTAAEINPHAFRSAIVIDATSGKVLFEQNADVQNPPASVTKLMTFLIVAEKIKHGELALDTPVTITAEAAKTGGSQVWLVDKEKIAVGELLYALMVQSANDAAVALAIQVAGSKEAFVELMNLKARELGLTHTVFHSPHGLPPARGQEADLTTARDLAALARRLLTGTDVLRYTSTREHDFRHQNGKGNKLANHNHLLGLVPGCDGLKTGWYQKAGYSLAATVQRNGRRIITVILGSPERKLRDITTTRLIEKGFAALAAIPAPIPLPQSSAQAAAPAPVPPSAAQPAPATDNTASLKLVPLPPGEQGKPLDSDPGPTVHLSIPGEKK
ncbi:MAG: D-alanyl-D-alanine carboxypeptidase [Opitutaceae bacterium]|nr:D-alanyl-D-alanine carboxypeptidase [Opitutaceae bacterium]